MQRKYQTTDNDRFFNKLVTQVSKKQEGYDHQRMLRLMMEQQDGTGNEQIRSEKTQVRIHKFREDARKHHRQIAQHNHDMLKITSQITQGALKMDRFQIPLNSEGELSSKDNLGKVDWEKSLKPAINLKLKLLFSSNIVEDKFDIKQLYQLVPFKNHSIQVSPSIYRDPSFQFFFFKTDYSFQKQIQSKLSQVVDDGLGDLRLQILEVTHYLDFFDYVNMLIITSRQVSTSKNENEDSKKNKKSIYQNQVLQIAMCAQQFGGDDDQEFNKNEIQVDQSQSFHRIFQCDETELAKPSESIYFKDINDYQNFKKLRQIQFKNAKIYAEDMFINTDVRNIISSQKIYLINIIEEIKLLLTLSEQNNQEYLYDKIHHSMINKIDQYLRLICGYTYSTLLIQYNVPDPYSKIYEFLKKSIMYQKPYRNPPSQVLVRYPILQLWYKLPDKLFGFTRDQIHDSLYELIIRTIEFQKKIAYLRKYQGLKVRKIDRKYNADQQTKKMQPTNLKRK